MLSQGSWHYKNYSTPRNVLFLEGKWNETCMQIILEGGVK